MELTKINGNTFYINAPTNIGVFSFKNKNCLLVDAGINNSAANKIDTVLKENKLHPKYIFNTHSHSDHCGGNNYFRKNYPGCQVYASKKEKVYMENMELRANMLFTSNAVKELEEECKYTMVDFIPDYGINKINDEKFEVISLKGHSPEGIGLITQDRVCFLGDSIFSSSILEKYSFPFLFNIEESYKTLESIKDIDSDYFVVSHAEKFYTKEEIIKLSDINRKNIDNYIEEMLELLDKPLTKEDLLENILILDDLDVSFKEYHINFSSMSSFLQYLCSKKMAQYSVQNGKVYYYKV